jgi:capsule biosynthesis phosphatase
MQIIIPLNGLGERFKANNYKKPKPLIKICGKEIILRCLANIISDNKILLICNKELKKYRFDDLIRKEFFEKKIDIIYLDEDTRGAAESVYKGLKLANIKDDEEILILDGDTLFDKELIENANSFNHKNVVFYNYDKNSEPHFSYIKIKNNQVIDIVEKEKISNKICIGAYLFESCFIFKKITKFLLDNNQTQKNEFFISGVYKQLIKENKQIFASVYKKYQCLGTPIQLQSASYNTTYTEKLRFVFDIDNTLQTYPLARDQYSTVCPIQNTINFVKKLKEQGHYIILYTARRMRTHNGDIQKVIDDVGEITRAKIHEMGIPYDEIIFGKPYAHFYIDDLAINCFDDLEKETGFYFNDIEPRPYHKINIENNIVIKRGNLEGESYWYNNCPPHLLKKYFPKFINISKDEIIMGKIHGINLSYVYTSNLLSEQILEKILTSIKEIHQTKQNNFKSTINLNYTEKIIERYETNYDLYKNFCDSEKIYHELIEFFKTYNYKECEMIHGDPVFSNIFYDIDNNIKFIDVRGKQGKICTSFGDANYDFAKLYQSIVGYDYILLNKELNFKNINYYKNFLTSTYSHIFNDNLKMITKSLLFSLLPLHEDFQKKQQYYNLIDKL